MLTKGEIIKKLREQKGLKQAELADGICSQTTLSRAESGTQEMSWYVFNKLLETMGEVPQNFMFAMTTAEKQVIELDRDITKCLNQEKYEDAKKLLDELEAIKELDKGSKRFAKFARVVIAKGEGLPASEAIQQLKETFDWLKKPITRQNYHQRVLNKNDFQVLDFLAICYTEVDEQQTVEIFYLQKMYIELVVANKDLFANAYTNTAHNLSRQLGLAKQYEEALSVAEDGIAWCDRYGRSHSLDGLLLNKACILIEMDAESVEGAKLLNLCYLSCSRKSQQAVCEYIKDFAITHNVSILY